MTKTDFNTTLKHSHIDPLLEIPSQLANSERVLVLGNMINVLSWQGVDINSE